MKRALSRSATARHRLERRVEAVELAQRLGTTDASRLTGIPKRTLQRWIAEERGGNGPQASRAPSDAARVAAVVDRLPDATGAAVVGLVTDLRTLVALAVDRAREEPGPVDPQLVREVARAVQGLGELDLGRQLFAPPSGPQANEAEPPVPSVPAVPAEGAPAGPKIVPADDWH
jgi:hypothetical protein